MKVTILEELRPKSTGDPSDPQIHRLDSKRTTPKQNLDPRLLFLRVVKGVCIR